ncbi:hypothetical protein C0T31_07360 [Dysgonamonadaceae bacterium]|jgi:hypothetical protein|nr:hypothetical protein C0T31_07360 [Dysgonamonadaceae bacterium]
MKVIVLLFILISTFGSGCTTNGSPKHFSDGTQTSKNIVSVSENQSQIEDFSTFFENFNDDRIFQLKRISFPIYAIVGNPDDEGLAPMKEVIEKQDWEYIDLSYDSTYVSRDYDQYLQRVRFASDSAIVELRGIDNGIYANYYFKQTNGKWFLVGIEDTSF